MGDCPTGALTAGSSKPGKPATPTEFDVGGTRRTGSLTGNDGAVRRREPGVLAEPMAGEYGVGDSGAAAGRSGVGADASGTASGGGGAVVVAVGMAGIELIGAELAGTAGAGSANGGGTYGAEGSGSVFDCGALGGDGAEGLGCVCSLHAAPSHQRMSAGLAASAYQPGATPEATNSTPLGQNDSVGLSPAQCHLRPWERSARRLTVACAPRAVYRSRL